jgi:C4-dicarboxylate-specific signal transduction histidine kinase
MPEWANSVWGKLIGLIATAIVSGMISAATTAVHFYHETQLELAVLKEQMTEVQNRLEMRIAANERKSQKHESQIASVVKQQDQLFGKEMPVGDAPTSVPIPAVPK